MKSSKITICTLILGLFFLYFPLLVVIGYSFNASRYTNVWAGFSLHWYKVLLDNNALLKAAWTSISIAFASATTAVILGTLAAWLITESRTKKILLSSLFVAPLIIPDIILGIAFLLTFITFFQFIGWPATHGIITIWLSHVTLCTSYVVVFMIPRFAETDVALQNSAMDLGATPVRTFFSITLPGLLPSIASSWLLAFTLSMDDVLIASFVTGPNATTLPIMILSSIKQGVSPQVNALATMFIIIVSMITLSAWLLINRVFNNRKKIYLPSIKSDI